MTPASSPAIVYLNGFFQFLDKASVSVLDRGFSCGDGIYEVVPFFDGVPFQLAAHLKRLQRSLDAVGIENPLSELSWIRIVRDLVAQNGEGDLAVYIQITRGVPPRDLRTANPGAATVFVMATPLSPDKAAEDARGVSAITHEDFRWQRCDIKSISLAANEMLKQIAARQGVQEVLLLRHEILTEAAGGNVFAVLSGEVVTPRLDNNLLAGITRKVVLDICRKNAFHFRETIVSKRMLQQAAEVWLTSSCRGVVPVTRIDNAPVGRGVPGPLWLSVHECYLERTGRLPSDHLTVLGQRNQRLSLELQ